MRISDWSSDVCSSDLDTPVSALAANLPSRHTASDRLQEMPVQLSRELLARFGREPTTLLALAGLGAQEPQAVDTTDGLRLTARSGEIVHLRPSGNAPELRCYSEAATRERARKMREEVLGGLGRADRKSTRLNSS